MADFTTTFPLTENPISEGGIWNNGLALGLDWFNCATSGGKAFGTQTGASANYSDSTSILTGTWANDQTVQATVFIDATNTTTFQEVELRLRSAMSAHSNTGYEILFSVNPSDYYVQIIRWNGSLGDFTDIGSGSTPAVVNGDVVKATIVGSAITAYVNGVSACTATSSTYSSGNPGMGFYLQFGSNPVATASNYGFSDFTVVGDTGGLGSSAVVLTGAPIF